MDKSELRKVYKSKRKYLSPEERIEKSQAVTSRFLTFLDKHPEIAHIHVFLPIEKLSEIDTFGLVEKMAARGCHLYTSVSDFATGAMQTIELEVPFEYELDSYGIPVPHHAHTTNGNAIQLVLIPLLAYDLGGNRLGYGRGFYDRFLDSLGHEVIKVGLSFFSPEESIPAEEHDIRLDFCVSPEQLYIF
ncbi:5-formyltetrahydrofolate cyclo-ligase [Litoribacter alkaliphilus]|uniref:5-formyltetrahydrofolate cyclo-ligase n=1 Tax=Litoribacter ruber TaxID=702568 RepID=A0AAP2CI44_9BACT|nr:5-formyltetrahydrofolate cyclo-ligase [Litoribacter alkaliphilus]MBS9523691.1 5-formyltetrahydrofolate cyclo-ligase [Litoribacter alkaliphilus]